MNITTETITLSLPTETVKRLRAFTSARNGSLSNQASAAICHGLDFMLAQAPDLFVQEYNKQLQHLQSKVDPLNSGTVGE